MQRLALWGHHVDEYQAMFGLSTADLSRRFLEYGCGPSAVNYELQGTSASMISFDPWFNQDISTLTSTIEQSFEARLAQVARDQENFDMQRYGTLEALIAYRRKGLAAFLQDYTQGLGEERYRPLVARLPVGDFTFDIALSAHYLFNEQDSLNVDAHLHVIYELARAAKEVRIFPLIDRQGVPSALLGPVLLALQQANYGVEVRNVDYHLQPKGNAMLRVWAQECKLKD